MRLRIAVWLMVLALAGPAWAAVAQTVQQVRVRWEAYVGAQSQYVPPQPGPPSPSFVLLERRTIPGSLRRERNPQLSSDQIVVVAVDGEGKEIDRHLIRDPRILRGEFPGPTGQIKGTVLHHATAEFLITLPDDPRITDLWLYHPRWTGTAYVLDLLGTIRLY